MVVVKDHCTLLTAAARCVAGTGTVAADVLDVVVLTLGTLATYSICNTTHENVPLQHLPPLDNEFSVIVHS